MEDPIFEGTWVGQYVYSDVAHGSYLIDPFDLSQVFWSIGTMVDASKQVYVVDGLSVMWDEPMARELVSAELAKGMGCLVVDSTKPVGECFDEVGYPDARMVDRIRLRCCPLRPHFVGLPRVRGRTASLHPHEALIKDARAFQQSEAFDLYRKLRQAAEHRLARLVWPGIRQARYFGRTKTRFQVPLAAMAADLTLVATQVGLGKLQRANPTSAV